MFNSNDRNIGLASDEVQELVKRDHIAQWSSTITVVGMGFLPPPRLLVPSSSSTGMLDTHPRYFLNFLESNLLQT